MKERPILFSGPMIRAILDGRKTQTWRAVKPKEPYPAHLYDGYPVRAALLETGEWGWIQDGCTVGFVGRCPYGQPGDRLWVRETFVVEDTYEYEGDHIMPTDGCPVRAEGDDLFGKWHLIPHYRATEPEPHIVPCDLEDGTDDGTRWTSSRYMPRWASRIMLEVTGVRVERLEDITCEDAKAEGVEPCDCPQPLKEQHNEYLCAFQELWERLNAKRGYGWGENPWCWVISFKRIEP